MAYEYETDYFDVVYFLEEDDIINRPLVPIEPNVESLHKSPLYIALMNRRGEESWELVSVTPLLRGCYHAGASFGYSLTAGYYFFWRRSK
jgi:hypothetical protein